MGYLGIAALRLQLYRWPDSTARAIAAGLDKVKLVQIHDLIMVNLLRHTRVSPPAKVRWR